MASTSRDAPMGEGCKRRVIISSLSVGDPRNPWSVFDVPSHIDPVQSEFNRTELVAAVLNKAKVRSLLLFWVLSQAYPQYFLIRRGAIGRGRDCSYLVSVREESYEGQTPDELKQMLMRASAAVILDIGLRSKYPEESLFEWFGSLPGRDRFDLAPRAWKV